MAKFYTFSWFSDTHKKISCSSNFMFWTVSNSNVNIYVREYLSRLCKFENFWKLLPQIENIFITGKIKHTLKYSKGHKIWAKRGIELQFSGLAPLIDTNRIYKFRLILTIWIPDPQWTWLKWPSLLIWNECYCLRLSNLGTFVKEYNREKFWKFRDFVFIVFSSFHELR